MTPDPGPGFAELGLHLGTVMLGVVVQSTWGTGQHLGRLGQPLSTRRPGFRRCSLLPTDASEESRRVTSCSRLISG